MMLLIRNMESDRCKRIVKEELKKLGVQYKYVELGEAELVKKISSEEFQLLDIALKKSGLELMSDHKTVLIDKIKESINQLLLHMDDIDVPGISDYISKRVSNGYSYLSKIFSEIEGITIEKYYIIQRINRVKDLLVYDGLSLNEIAFKLHFSSVAHLSNQFKKVTGLTPFNFRQYSKKRVFFKIRSLRVI
jgi:AraC-like DNA-binding protein